MRLGWLKWIVLLLVGIPAALVVAGYIILTTWDFDELRQLAQEQARKITGRDLRIEGPIDIAFSLTPAITLQDIRFENMPGGSAEEMAQIDRLEVQVALLPLLQRQIEIKQFLLQDAEILLETNSEGQANWIFASRDEPAEPEQQVEEAAQTQERVQQQLPRLENVTIEDSRLIWRNGVTGQEFAVNLANARLAERDDRLEVEASGAYQEVDFAAEGTVGTPQELLAGGSFPMDLTGHLATTRYSLSGALSGLPEQLGADVQVSLEGDDLPAFSRLAGQDLPDIGTYALEGRVTYDGETATFQQVEARVGESLLAVTGEARSLTSGAPVVETSLAGEGPALEQLAALAGVDLHPLGAWRLEGQVDATSDRIAIDDLSLHLGEMGLQGAIELALGGARPALKGQLASQGLDLTALLPEDQESPQDSGSGGGEDSPFVIPDTPLPLEALQAADAYLELKVDRLRLPNELEFENIDLAVRLSAGDLTLQPRTFGFYDGDLAGTIRIDTSQQPAALSTDLQLQGLDIGRLMREREITDAMRGLLHAKLAVNGRGNSPRAIASTLNGRSELEVGEGTISNRLLAVIGSGLDEIMNPLFGGQDTTQLNCVLSQVDFQDGIAINRAAVIDTNTFSIVGSGRVNLQSENLDLHFDTSSRVPALVSLAIPFNVRGTLKNPQFAPDPLGTAQRAAELAGIEISPPEALAALMGMSEERAASEENPCAVVVDADISTPTEPAQPSDPRQQLEDLGRGLLERGLSGDGDEEDSNPADEIGRRLRGLFGN